MTNYILTSPNPKTFLFKQNPLSFSGNLDNHIDAYFSWCVSLDFSFSSDKEHRIAFNFCVFCWNFSTLIFVFGPVYIINCILF